MELAVILIVTLTYVGVGLGGVPIFRMNRASIAFTGAALCVLVGVFDLEQAWRAIDGQTIVLLLAMMLLNANLALSGFFRLVARVVLAQVRTPQMLLAGIVVSSGVLSALFLNDTVVLMLTPLVAVALKRLERNPVPYLLALALSANAGSVATITGNPQNILIGTTSGISFLNFAARLSPVALVSMLIVFVLVRLSYRQEFSSRAVFAFTKPLPVGRVHTPHLLRSLLATLGMLVAFLAGVNVAAAALIAASWLLITRRIKPERIWNEVNWNLLVLFAGMFVVTHALEAAGLSSTLFAAARPLLEAGSLAFSAVSAVLSNLVSNVPAVLLFLPVLKDSTETTWLLLAMSSTLAGNLTLVGSVANLIVAEESARRGVKIGFLEYLKLGVPVTLLSIGFGVWWLGL
jgi:Na+/H+ antiporter NhaD/arsenite permease-like protein